MSVSFFIENSRNPAGTFTLPGALDYTWSFSLTLSHTLPTPHTFLIFSPRALEGCETHHKQTKKKKNNLLVFMCET